MVAPDPPKAPVPPKFLGTGLKGDRQSALLALYLHIVEGDGATNIFRKINGVDAEQLYNKAGRSAGIVKILAEPEYFDRIVNWGVNLVHQHESDGWGNVIKGLHKLLENPKVNDALLGDIELRNFLTDRKLQKDVILNKTNVLLDKIFDKWRKTLVEQFFLCVSNSGKLKELGKLGEAITGPKKEEPKDDEFGGRVKKGARKISQLGDVLKVMPKGQRQPIRIGDRKYVITRTESFEKRLDDRLKLI